MEHWTEIRTYRVDLPCPRCARPVDNRESSARVAGGAKVCPAECPCGWRGELPRRYPYIDHR